MCSPIYQGSFLIATSSNSPISCTSPKIANKTNLPTSSTPYPSVFNPPVKKVPKIQIATTSDFPSEITALSEAPKAATTHYKTSFPSGAPLRQYTLSDLKNPAAADTDMQALSNAALLVQSTNKSDLELPNLGNRNFLEYNQNNIKSK